MAYVDVDDEFDVDMLEYEFKLAQKTNADIVCLGVAGLESQIGSVINRYDAVRMLLERKIGMSCCNKLFRTELVATGVFPAGIRIHEDLFALYSALCMADRIVCDKKAKYHYVHHEGSSSRPTLFSEKFFDGIRVIDDIVENVNRRWATLFEVADARRAYVYLRISKIYWLRGAPLVYRKRIKEIKNELRHVPFHTIKRYFTRNDQVRLALYLYCFPVFMFLLWTIDRN